MKCAPVLLTLLAGTALVLAARELVRRRGEPLSDDDANLMAEGSDASNFFAENPLFSQRDEDDHPLFV